MLSLPPALPSIDSKSEPAGGDHLPPFRCAFALGPTACPSSSRREGDRVTLPLVAEIDPPDPPPPLRIGAFMSNELVRHSLA